MGFDAGACPLRNAVRVTDEETEENRDDEIVDARNDRCEESSDETDSEEDDDTGDDCSFHRLPRNVDAEGDGNDEEKTEIDRLPIAFESRPPVPEAFEDGDAIAHCSG